MKSFALIVSMALLATFLNGCMKSLSQSHITGPKTYKQKMDMRYNLLRRTYHLHVPPIYDGKEPLPLVVVIHGAFDTAKGMEKVTGFSELADRENFLVLYPNGIGLFGFLQHWNAGHCCGKAADDDVDDVRFITATIDDACSRLNVDRTRIYMVGFRWLLGEIQPMRGTPFKNNAPQRTSPNYILERMLERCRSIAL